MWLFGFCYFTPSFEAGSQVYPVWSSTPYVVENDFKLLILLSPLLVLQPRTTSPALCDAEHDCGASRMLGKHCSYSEHPQPTLRGLEWTVRKGSSLPLFCPPRCDHAHTSNSTIVIGRAVMQPSQEQNCLSPCSSRPSEL